jgi:molecular chaperone DnaJ
VKTSEARKLLGITPDATPQAIKKAFRHLAMLWHPDRNPAPEANEMFARLNMACNLLLEPFEQDDPDDGSDGAAATDKQDANGEDRVHELELDLEQICLGGKAEAVLESQTECMVCGGAGIRESTHSQLCHTCHGSGRVKQGKNLAPCADCNGRGYSRRAPCPECKGSGRQTTRRVLTVTVPAGMLPGDELRLEGEGHPAPSRKGRPGNLRLRIQLRPHPLYTLEGSDLVLERPVSVFTLLGGGTIVVPSPDGARYLDIKPGSGGAREQSISGGGVPARGKRAAGKLRVRLTPVLPSTSTAALLKLYHALQAEIERAEPSPLPELADWEKRWLSGPESSA